VIVKFLEKNIFWRAGFQAARHFLKNSFHRQKVLIRNQTTKYLNADSNLPGEPLIRIDLLKPRDNVSTTLITLK